MCQEDYPILCYRLWINIKAKSRKSFRKCQRYLISMNVSSVLALQCKVRRLPDDIRLHRSIWPSSSLHVAYYKHSSLHPKANNSDPYGGRGLSFSSCGSYWGMSWSSGWSNFKRRESLYPPMQLCGKLSPVVITANRLWFARVSCIFPRPRSIMQYFDKHALLQSWDEQ